MPGKPYMLEPELEGMSRGLLKERQLELLKKTVETCYTKVEMYREKFDEKGLKPSDIKTLEDLKKLPFTSKEDLRLRYPMNGTLAIPQEDVVRVHTTSGTTGKPTVSPFGKNDLILEHKLLARFLAAAGGTKGDVLQCIWGYGLFLGGLVFGPAAELIGMRHIPSGSSVPSARQLELMQDFGTTIMGGTPSFFLHVTEVAKEQGIDLQKMGVRVLMEGGEACSQGTREKLSQAWNAGVFDMGGTCELFHIWHECSEHTGLHITEDVCIFEVLDPDTDEEVGPGERGELVVTTLMKEAMPVLRWRTRDITSMIREEPCPCGRTSRQVDHLSGRVDDMVKVKGVCVYPSQIEEILKSVDEVKDSEFQIVISTTQRFTDTITIRVEIPDDYSEFSEVISKKIEEKVKNKLILSSKVESVKHGTLPRFTHKAKRVVDSRDIGNQ